MKLICSAAYSAETRMVFYAARLGGRVPAGITVVAYAGLLGRVVCLRRLTILLDLPEVTLSTAYPTPNPAG